MSIKTHYTVGVIGYNIFEGLSSDTKPTGVDVVPGSLFYSTDLPGTVEVTDGAGSWHITSTDGSAYVNASPAKTIAITASDVTVYDPPLLGFRVGTTAGDVAAKDLYGDITVIPAVQVGETIAGGYTQIMATDTTAAGITGWST